jgi:restriction system protein
MKKYYRIMLGAKSAYATDCYNNNYIGANYGINEDLTNKLPENWKEFNKLFIPKYMALHPDKSKIAAGLSCGALWTIAKGLQRGDVVLCPNGAGSYYVGEVMSEYIHQPSSPLQHQRSVKWYPVTIERSIMSDALRNSTGSIGTVSDISSYSQEIESLMGGYKPQVIYVSDETIEDPSVFAMENHLEDFLVKNWKQTELGKYYNIFEEDGELIGQQYRTDTGPMDILAISKDNKSLLVVELKRGRASDSVVGQIQRYMGFVKEELAEAGQTVKGVIIALDDDIRIKRALSVTNNIEFYRYEINFKLFKN